MKLTQENYHSNEANKQYMSVSQYKVWRECESRAYAQFVTKEWRFTPSDSIHVGQIVHKHFDGSLDEYLENHPELVSSRGKSKGELKSTYQHAFKMINTLENDKLCMEYLQGEHEKIIDVDLYGWKWRAMLDVVNLEKGFFSDIKTTASITKKQWKTYEVDGHDYNNKVSFIESFDYYLQFAVYSEILRIHTGSNKWLDSFLVAVSSEGIPDKAVINMYNANIIRDRLTEVAENTPRIMKLKKGEIEPTKCNKCNYCKSTKMLTDFIYPEDL